MAPKIGSKSKSSTKKSRMSTVPVKSTVKSTVKPTVKPTTKKAFDLARDSVYVADPVAELRICGGRDVLPDEEAGDLDTPAGLDVPVQDMRRLRRELPASFLANVARDGVRTPIVIAKIDDVATVIAGKSRVRAARRANRERTARGVPPMRVRCVMQRDVGQLAVLGTMISENNARQDDDLADRIEKLKLLLAAGASEADAATTFNVKQSTIRGWLDYDDHATDDVKRAVRDGELGASTAAELAKVKDPDAQRAALGEVLGASGVKRRSARAVRALRKGRPGEGGPSPARSAACAGLDEKSQASLLAYVDRGLADMARADRGHHGQCVRMWSYVGSTEIGEAVAQAQARRLIQATHDPGRYPGIVTAMNAGIPEAENLMVAAMDVGYWQGVRAAMALASGGSADRVDAALLRALEKSREAGASEGPAGDEGPAGESPAGESPAGEGHVSEGGTGVAAAPASVEDLSIFDDLARAP